MEPMTGVVASRANDRFAGIHRKGGGANDCCGYHFDIYRDNRLADCLWYRLGHESVKTTLDTYSHLYPDKDQKLLIAFGSFVIALLAFLDRDKEHKRKK